MNGTPPGAGIVTPTGTGRKRRLSAALGQEEKKRGLLTPRLGVSLKFVSDFMLQLQMHNAAQGTLEIHIPYSKK